MTVTKKTALLLALLTIGTTLASCGETSGANETKETLPAGEENTAESETVEIDPFEGFDFGGDTIRMLVSANDYDGLGSSNYLIKHEEAENGDVVRDAVYKRNMYVEELLNVKFTFTDNEDNYEAIPKTLSNLIMAGDDAYDLVIHDLFPLATLSVSGNFLNVREGKYFDFSKDYWYTEYMTDLSFGTTDQNYILAGDYFLDVIRCAHALYFNKDKFRDLYESPDELYDHVRNGTWTFDVFMSYVQDAYQDVNGDGTADNDDFYGYSYIGKWGSMIPWCVSSDLNFLVRESDGTPSLGLNNERSVVMLQHLNDLFYAVGAHDFADVQVNTEAFMSGKALFGGYQRVSSLETFRDMTYEIGVLPYPKFDEKQENYITSSHDTANVGVIPMTCTKFDTMSAVLEVLSRETNKSVMPTYYETALKIKYSRDDDSAQMLDIIRDGISCVFPVAYGNYCNNTPLYNAFSLPLQSKKTEFVSNYEKYSAKAQAKLDELWEAFTSIDD